MSIPSEPVRTYDMFDKLRYEIDTLLNESHVNQQQLHHELVKRLEKIFDDLEEKHNLAAHKMTIAIVASALGIVGSCFDEKQKAGRIINAISGMGMKVNDFLQQLDRGQINRLEGMQRLLLEEIQKQNKIDDRQLEKWVRGVDSIVDEGLRNMHDAARRAAMGG